MTSTNDSEENTYPLSRAWKIVPIFRSDKILDTIEFYNQILNFSRPEYFSQCFVALQCGKSSHRRSVFIYFACNESHPTPPGHARIFLNTADDLDALFLDLSLKDVYLMTPLDMPENLNERTYTCTVSRPYQLDGFSIVTLLDPSGNRIDFCAIIDSRAQGEESPDDGSMSSEEYDRECEKMA